MPGCCCQISHFPIQRALNSFRPKTRQPLAQKLKDRPSFGSPSQKAPVRALQKRLPNPARQNALAPGLSAKAGSPRSFRIIGVD